MPSYLLGLDVSTTGSKALLIDESGRVVRTATNEHPLSTPRPAWSEQDPADWWTASAASIRQVIADAGIEANEIAGVGLTGQMHGLVLLDRAGDVLRPAILWNDQRTAAQCAAITEKVGAKEVLRITGNPVLPGFTAPKIVWVRENEPQVYERAASFLLPKDYVRFRMTGALVCDVSDASGTSVFDVGRRTWSEEMLDAMEIPREWVPEVTESPVVSARINAEGAAATGLLEGTPVVSGASDNAAAAVGTGIIRPGVISASLGTSGVVFAPLETYQPEPEGRLHAFCHAVPGQWHLMGVMLSAAGSLRWYRDALAGEGDPPSFDTLVEEAGRVDPGSEGLLFLPYLSGERTPHPDPDARGAFVGLSLRHGRGHLTRAVLEGVAFGLRDSLDLMKPLGIAVDRVRVAGGGTRSPVWRQILADVFDARLATTDATEGAAYGAALLGGVGAEVFASVEAASDLAVREVEQMDPGENVGRYQRFHERYRALYPALADEFHAMARLLED